MFLQSFFIILDGFIFDKPTLKLEQLEDLLKTDEMKSFSQFNSNFGSQKVVCYCIPLFLLSMIESRDYLSLSLPKIESAKMMFSASRSRRLQIVPIIQSFAQLEKNYGKEGADIIIDNT